MRIESYLLPAAVAAALSVVPGHATAHVTLEDREAAAGSYHKVVLRVPHGCEGSPTTSLRVQIPEGVVGVKPQPKPGWDVETVIGEFAEPVDAGHGSMVTEGVQEVGWVGGRLLDEHYDEFAMRVRLPDEADSVLYFLTVQECEEGVHRWIEIPEEGRSAGDYDKPAPALRLISGNGR